MGELRPSPSRLARTRSSARHARGVTGYQPGPDRVPVERWPQRRGQAAATLAADLSSHLLVHIYRLLQLGDGDELVDGVRLLDVARTEHHQLHLLFEGT